MKTILVTGASTGIGEACALHLDRLGHRIYAGVRKDADAQRLRGGASERLVPVLVDVTDQAQIDAVAKQIGEEAGALHGLVNNAGIARGGPLEYLPIEEWREQLEVNVIGQVAVTKATLPLIREGAGRITFIGSIGGKVANPMTGPYNASKYAIEAIVASLRQELQPWGIHVSVIEPGAIKTAIWDKANDSADRLERELPEEAHERYARHIAAVRKMITFQDGQAVGPEKVAKAVEHALFASRPRSHYLVGTDARAMSALARLLPDRPREFAIRRFMGL